MEECNIGIKKEKFNNILMRKFMNKKMRFLFLVFLISLISNQQFTCEIGNQQITGDWVQKIAIDCLRLARHNEKKILLDDRDILYRQYFFNWLSNQVNKVKKLNKRELKQPVIVSHKIFEENQRDVIRHCEFKQKERRKNKEFYCNRSSDHRGLNSKHQ